MYSCCCIVLRVTGSLPELLSLFQLFASDSRWEADAAQCACDVLQLTVVVATRYAQEGDALSAVVLLVRGLCMQQPPSRRCCA